MVAWMRPLDAAQRQDCTAAYASTQLAWHSIVVLCNVGHRCLCSMSHKLAKCQVAWCSHHEYVFAGWVAPDLQYA